MTNRTSTKRIARIVIDTAMLFLFVFEMSLREGRNIFLHGLLGTLLFVVFVVHLCLNYRFYKTLFRGKYSARRIFLVTVDMLLSVLMLVMIFSSLMISGMPFSFMPFFKFEWILIHKAAASWTFLIMIFHLGLHTNSLFTKLEKLNAGNNFAFPFSAFVKIAEAVFFLAGIFFFAKSRLWSAMFFYDRFVYVPSVPVFFLQYAVIIIAGCVVVHWIEKLLGRKNYHDYN